MDVYDAPIWLEDPAGQAFREAALLDSPGYLDSCAALLPYQRALGLDSAATAFQLGDKASGMIALLVDPTEDMPQRARLYRETFRPIERTRTAPVQAAPRPTL